jgi:protein-disulfide isomerase
MSQKARRAAPTKAGKKGNRSFITLIGILGVAGLAVIGYLVYGPKPSAVVALDPKTPLPEAKGYVRGSDSALVEIVEYGDFECPGCGQFATITEPDVRTRIVDAGLARFRFVDAPIPSIHLNTLVAHNAAACADAQGKFWDMHDKLYAGQFDWSVFVHGKHSGNPAKVFRGYAKDMGLDEKSFAACLDARTYESQIRANQASGVARGMQYTPTFFIGNRMLSGAQPYDVIKALVDTAIAAAKKK